MTCSECLPCTTQGCDNTAHCLADTSGPPCVHDTGTCDDCRLIDCPACINDLETYLTGDDLP